MSFRTPTNRAIFIKVYKCLRMNFGDEQALWALGQGALESNWYSSQLSVVALNYWGIKATPNWKGAVWDGPTNEVLQGRMVKVRAGFRAYPSTLASIKDYSSLLERLYGAPLNQSSYRAVGRQTRTTPARC
jgi:flagellum-specific peptidoglycan hydrolase FlgJ